MNRESPIVTRFPARTRFIRFQPLILLFIAPPAFARLEVNVTHVGFPTLQQGRNVIRAGSWVPITVDLSLLDEPSFDGTVRVAQYDVDGDEGYDSVDVHLRSETGGSQRLFLYTVVNPHHGRDRITVEIRDSEDRVVTIVSNGEVGRRAVAAQPVEVMADDGIFILSVSSSTVGRIEDLIGPDQREQYDRPLYIGHVSPADLPELWLGLEAVDFIRWDDADPDKLSERQLSALLEWVRQGGTLLIMASRTAGAIKLSRSLYSVLPSDIGDAMSVADLPETRTKLLGLHPSDVAEEGGFDESIPVIRCTTRPDAREIVQESFVTSDLFARRDEGQGTVIFGGVTERDLFRGAGSAIDFYRTLFHLMSRSETSREAPHPVSLFRRVVSAVAFTFSGTWYLLLAAVFCIAYVGVATVGVWTFLNRRGWKHHNWSGFASVALAACFLSLLAVNSIHGFGDRLHQISIVDLEADQAHGRATAFFGIKSGLDKSLDVWLPSDAQGAVDPTTSPCFLRPIPPGNDPSEVTATFADPEEYRILPSTAEIHDVRLRATLKRFEGRWTGPVGGRLSGKIAVQRYLWRGDDGEGAVQSSWRITEDSYVVNQLGVTLSNCYLLLSQLDAGGVNARRDDKITAFPIGEIPVGSDPFLLAKRCYRGLTDKAIESYVRSNVLTEAQREWNRPFLRALATIGYGRGADAGFELGLEQNALLLLSTISEFNPNLNGSLMAQYGGLQTWSRDRLRQMDLRELMRKDTVVLIGFAEGPGPVRLFRRQDDGPYRMLEPETGHSMTMYRIAIPVSGAARDKSTP